MMKKTILQIVVPAAFLLSTVVLVSGCGQSYGSKIVRAGENEITVRDSQGYAQRTHEVAADAVITLDGKPVDLEQLDAGDAVNVTTEKRLGKEVATEIRAKANEAHETTPMEKPEGDASAYPNEPSAEPLGSQPAPEPALPLTLPGADRSTAEWPASDQEPAPDNQVADTFEGKISSIATDNNQFVVKIEGAEDIAFKVNDETKYRLDGEDAAFGDLKEGYMVKVTSEKRDGSAWIAKSVDATTK